MAELAAEAKPLAGQGRPAQGEKTLDTKVYGKDSTCLTARIARDAPEVLAKMKAGDYPSVRAAAPDAGIVKKRITLLPTVEGFAATARKHLSPEDITTLTERLQG